MRRHLRTEPCMSISATSATSATPVSHRPRWNRELLFAVVGASDQWSHKTYYCRYGSRSTAAMSPSDMTILRIGPPPMHLHGLTRAHHLPSRIPLGTKLWNRTTTRCQRAHARETDARWTRFPLIHRSINRRRCLRSDEAARLQITRSLRRNLIVPTADSRLLLDSHNDISKPGAQQRGLGFHLCQSENIQVNGELTLNVDKRCPEDSALLAKITVDCRHHTFHHVPA